MSVTHKYKTELLYLVTPVFSGPKVHARPALTSLAHRIIQQVQDISYIR